MTGDAVETGFPVDVERELAIIEGIERGLADMKAGRVTPHEEVMARAYEIITEARLKRSTPQ